MSGRGGPREAGRMNRAVRARVVGWLAALALVSAAATGAAQAEDASSGEGAAEADVAVEVSEADDARARELYRLGDDLYAQGRYEEALAAFEEAYELSHRDLLLFNIANAQERAGHWEDAIVTLRTYLGTVEGDEHTRIESRLESLEGRVERLRAMQQNPNQQPVAPPPPPPRSPVGPVLLGAGGAMLGAGIAFAVLAGGARDDLDALCHSRDGRTLCPTEADSAQTRDRAFSISADVAFLAAAGLVAVGLVVLLKSGGDDSEDAEDAEEPDVDVSAAMSPRGAMVGVHGSF